MKKSLFLLIIAGLFFGGCTSKEQDEKIHAFWGEQTLKVMSSPVFSQVMMKIAMRNAGKMGSFGEGQDFDEKEFEKAMAAFQALQGQGFNEQAVNDFQKQADAEKGKTAKRDAVITQEQKTAVLITPAAQKTNGGDNRLLQMLAAVKESNARTLQEYSFLSADQQKRIKQVMTETEEDLQDLVSKNADMDSFMNAQMNLLIAQDNRINQIIMEELSDRGE